MLDPLRVLIVEDSEDDTLLMVRELQRGGFDPVFERVQTPDSMTAALQARAWDLIISDYSMPQFGGGAALTLFKQQGLDIPFIAVSGVIGEDTAVEMMKAGADDYVMKSRLARLAPAVRRELRAAQERHVRKQAEAAMAHLASIVESCEDAIVGETLDGVVTSWNTGAQRLYGYAPQEMIGRPVSILVPAFRSYDSNAGNLWSLLKRFAFAKMAKRSMCR